MDLKELIKIWAYTVSLAFFVTFCYAFITAYLHPCKCVNVYINLYNEANIELFVLITGVIAVILTFYWWWKNGT